MLWRHSRNLENIQDCSLETHSTCYLKGTLSVAMAHAHVWSNRFSPGFIFVQHASYSIWKIAFYPRLNKCHRRSQIFPIAFRRFWLCQSFGVIQRIRFLIKMSLLTLRGLFERLRVPSQSQKGHFYEKTNALNDTKTSAMSKSAEGNGEYLSLWHLSRRG